MSRVFFVVGFLFITVVCVHGAPPVIVLDAGHGGKSPGAVYKNAVEKQINLTVVLLAGEQLQKMIPEARIVYTRTNDQDVALKERTDLANNAEADIFISIHCNANPSSSAAGTETYVMGVDKNGANLEVAMRENSVITLEDNFSSSYGGFDPKSAESYIIFSLQQYAHQDQSLRLAADIQKQLAANSSLANRGVKQAGFLVLWRTTMPSVLCEIGFISNDNDRAYLLSTKGQKATANAIATAAAAFVKSKITTSNAPQNNTLPLNNKATQSDKPNTQTNNITTYKPNTTEVEPKFVTPNQNKTQSVCYRVQVATTSKQIPINSQNFGPWVTVVNEHKSGNLYKYSIGTTFSYKDALNLQRKLETTYKDCFVVAYDGEKQISLEKAKLILGK